MSLLDAFAHFGRDPWCSRGPFRAQVLAIFRWATARAGTIVGPAWIYVGLHTLNARPVRTELGCTGRYRSGSNDGTRVSWGPAQTALLTPFGHPPIYNN